MLDLDALGDLAPEEPVVLKVADYYEEEVRNLTDGMMKLIEPLLIIFLGLVVLFIAPSAGRFQDRPCMRRQKEAIRFATKRGRL